MKIATVLAATGIALALTGPALADEAMNDLEIAHAAYTADEIDIRYGHLALAISESEIVRTFASTMIRDHVAVNAAAAALLAQLGAEAQDNGLSQALAGGATETRAVLAGLTGAEFDCAYAVNELGYHRLVNKTVAEDFIPAVTVPELRTLLTDALVTFRVHEADAERMVADLQCGG